VPFFLSLLLTYNSCKWPVTCVVRMIGQNNDTLFGSIAMVTIMLILLLMRERERGERESVHVYIYIWLIDTGYTSWYIIKIHYQCSTYVLST